MLLQMHWNSQFSREIHNHGFSRFHGAVAGVNWHQEQICQGTVTKMILGFWRHEEQLRLIARQGWKLYNPWDSRNRVPSQRARRDDRHSTPSRQMQTCRGDGMVERNGKSNRENNHDIFIGTSTTHVAAGPYGSSDQ